MDKQFEDAKKLYADLHLAASLTIRGGAQHAPLIVIQKKSGEMAMIPEVGDLPKQIIAALHKTAALLDDVAFAAFICESWMYKGTDKRIVKALEDNQISVRDVPNAEDCVMFSLRCGDRVFFAAPKISVKGNRRVLGRAALVDSKAEGSSVEGRFA